MEYFILLTDCPAFLTETGSANFALPVLLDNVTVEGFVLSHVEVIIIYTSKPSHFIR